MASELKVLRKGMLYRVPVVVFKGHFRPDPAVYTTLDWSRAKLVKWWPINMCVLGFWTAYYFIKGN